MKSLIQTLKKNKTLTLLSVFVVLFIITAAVTMPYAVPQPLKNGVHSLSLVAGSLVKAEGDGGGDNGGGGDGGGDNGGGGDGGGDNGGEPAGGDVGGPTDQGGPTGGGTSTGVEEGGQENPPTAPPSPTGLVASCPAPGTTVSFSWSATPGATVYALRADLTSNPWSGQCDGAQNPGDICHGQSGTSFSTGAHPGNQYVWWVHACNASGCSAPTAGPVVTCAAPPPPAQTPAPTCTLSANPSSITSGSSSILSWTTTNATSGSIDHGVGVMTPIAGGFRAVSPITDTTYTATVTGPGGTVICSAPVTVQPHINAPSCTLTVNPSSITRGDSTVISWTTENATSGTLNYDIGEMTPIAAGSVRVWPPTSKTFTATVTGPGGTVTCSAPVTVTQPPGAPPGALRCDLFTANPSVVDRGGTSNLQWETTNATSVTIDNGVGSVTLDGNANVQVQNDTTYTLTAHRDNDTAVCTTQVTVRSGGGGFPSPRCDFLTASNTNINPGDRVILNWQTHYGTTLRVEDDNNNQIVTTSNSNDVNIGNVVVRPLRSTRYTLVVEQGNRNDTCTAFVNVGNQNISLISSRDQQPLTSISLTQVPYTGFDAGPFLTSVFYTLLALWSASVAYVLVIKKGAVFGFVLRGRKERLIPAGEASELPHTAYQSYVPPQMYGTEPETEIDHVAAYLEERAHRHNLVLSSDAIRLITDHAHSREEQDALLDEIIARAKETYPREDGWIAINSERASALFSTDS